MLPRARVRGQTWDWLESFPVGRCSLEESASCVPPEGSSTHPSVSWGCDPSSLLFDIGTGGTHAPQPGEGGKDRAGSSFPSKTPRREVLELWSRQGDTSWK